jgi:hypothetical protein
MHDSCVVVSLLKAIPIVLTVKILVIFKLAKGLAPWASVWCGGEWANAYPLKSLGGGSYRIWFGTVRYSSSDTYYGRRRSHKYS